MGLDSELYRITRMMGKAASIANDVKLLGSGNIAGFARKKGKAAAHKGLAQFMRGLK